MNKYLYVLLPLLLIGCGDGSGSGSGSGKPVVTTSNNKILLTDFRLQSQIYLSNPENDYANKDTLKILPSTNALDGSEIVACSWEIGNINVSDNCEYKLAENEHLSPITVSVKLTYNGMTSKTLTKTFNKAFPIEQVSNSYSKVTLFNNGEVLEWDHILDDSELAYHAEHRF
ncbi:hypothetical protein [Moritella viscosa]|uniref:hypothetical protein n=1 Tax=Moritella viscosa TaxID=80854 RepID=UPI00091BCCA1|nr:hypothetical protein [Moritella viscosa]SGY86454.1 Lipoprotein, putative [Moritella viscosa]